MVSVKGTKSGVLIPGAKYLAYAMLLVYLATLIGCDKKDAATANGKAGKSATEQTKTRLHEKRSGEVGKKPDEFKEAVETIVELTPEILRAFDDMELEPKQYPAYEKESISAAGALIQIEMKLSNSNEVNIEFIEQQINKLKSHDFSKYIYKFRKEILRDLKEIYKQPSFKKLSEQQNNQIQEYIDSLQELCK